ncbi:MAG: hypothetical protein H7X99_01590 [Saprospiraceae bacterium]|nr:hypothetical protein [Saprospiraceae bacterium]
MNRMIPGLLACAALLFISVSHSFGQVTYRIVTRVLSEDHGEPVIGATLKIIYSFSEDFKTTVMRYETTDWEGMAYREFLNSGYFSIIVTHPDFETESETKSMLYCGKKMCDINFDFKLRRKSNLKVVTIAVTEPGGNGVVSDASIVMDGDNERFTTSTDVEGKAMINVENGGKFSITVSHAGFKTEDQELVIDKYSDQNVYALHFSLVPTNAGFQRTLRVSVVTRKDGEIIPVEDVLVRIEFEGSTSMQATDANGKSDFLHSYPAGEEVKVTVEKQGYKTQTGKLMITTRGVGLGTNIDGINFTLVKASTVSHKMVINITDPSGNPVKYADLNFPDGTLKITDGKGICNYEHNYAEGEDINIEVEKKGYKSKSVKVDATKPYLSIILEKEEDASTWNGTYTDVYSTLNVSGNGGSITASWTYTVNDATGTGNWLNCKISGNTVTGEWQVQHADDTKTGARKGTLKASLSGNTISGEYLEDTPIWNYKDGFSAANVFSSMVKGKVWPFSMTKK